MERLLSAYYLELKKAFRQKSLHVVLIFVFLIVVAHLLLSPVKKDGISDYDFVINVTTITLHWIIPVLLLVLNSQLVSSEIASGTIRIVMVRPLKRYEFCLAKFALGGTNAIVLTLWAALLTWGFVLVWGDATGVIYAGDVLFSNIEMLRDYLFGLVLYLIALLGLNSFAVFFSVIARSPGTSVAFGLGVWITADAVKYAFKIDRYLVSTYMSKSWDIFVQHARGIECSWSPEWILSITVSLITILVFLFAAILTFQRKDLHT